MRLRFPALAVLLALAAAGCDAGPEGPAGPTGPEGPEGPQGNANVIVTTFPYGDNCQRVNNNVICNEAWDGLTQAIVDDGAVFAYRRSANSAWIALPSTERLDIDLDGTTEVVEFGFRYVPAQVSLWVTVLESTTEFLGIIRPGEVRVVAIAGAGGARRATPPPYAELARAYGLPLD